jgi:uncharacterized protein YijF (DUF1287 family)
MAEVSFATKLSNAALERTKHNITYDGSYYAIAYPGGDVPKNIGVCTDVIIRSYRALGVDLQRLVHEDMSTNFHLYPKIWGLKRPDTNIDHRRVPNLKVFFTRHGSSLPISDKAEAYQPGDIVTWNIANLWRSTPLSKQSIPHIGIVSNERSELGVPLIIHNIGWGVKLEDMLFSYKITGHYRYKKD